jgi:hypothetical protein
VSWNELYAKMYCFRQPLPLVLNGTMPLNFFPLQMSKCVLGKIEKETFMDKQVFIRKGLLSRQMFKYPVLSQVPRGILEH